MDLTPQKYNLVTWATGLLWRVLQALAAVDTGRD
jgi:hypothetical protein